MSLIDNINDVAFVNQQSVDKIIRIFTGSFNAATDVITRSYTLGGSPFNVSFYRIAHGLTRPVACELMWSLDNITFIDGGVQDTSARGSLAYSDSTYIYIFRPVTTGTVYYKVWCSWIDNYDGTNPLVETKIYSSNPIQFDSRENYQKIKYQDVLSFTAGTLGAQETKFVIHHLDYAPNAKVWFEAFSGEVWPLNAGGVSNPFLVDDAQDECQLFIDTDTVDIRLTKFSNLAKRAWYKVYYDAT